METNFDYIVVGCGFAGSVMARKLAEEGDKKVLIIDKRSHLGGNAYDFVDEAGVLIHKYGPHIFHTNNENVYKYLSNFTKWYDYSHEVVGSIGGNYIPIPFNLNSLKLTYEEDKAERLKEKLLKVYGLDKKVSILELQNQQDEELIELGKYIYENVFLYYTMKQWGQSPNEIDKSVIARVPVHISYDNRYFQDKFQGVPRDGYTKVFENLLNHPNITVKLKLDAGDILKFTENQVYVDNKVFNGGVIYTGAIDELMKCKYGRLPYRTLDFKFETHNIDYYQPRGTVNYTVDEPYTRITEFKYLSGQKISGTTTIVKEYSRQYTGAEGETPYYAILNEENRNKYDEYCKDLKKVKNVYLLGRLAEYKYYNMDQIVAHALELADKILNN
ncbi:UDP-galactopyranose mutase [Clostridium culturomicium]|uniref:UDP-galactopyranose mutase n=1 Tax=Clostridium culturomicium TaxID=1499683 RepID=UPI00058F4B39|nr:UDP-galactopyranose mutase [Clostridium culturomicium]